MIPIITGQLTLTHKSEVAVDTVKLRFSFSNLKTLTGEPHHENFNFAPGQFVSIGFSATAWRAYSIASTNQEKELELVVRLVEDGVGSEAFKAAEIGTSFEFKGPFGHFQLSKNENAHLVFCATGTGIAPFRAMVKAEQSAACETQNCRITQLLDNLDYTDDLEFYLCGNGAMVKSVQEILEAKEVSKEKIFMERFN